MKNSNLQNMLMCEVENVTKIIFIYKNINLSSLA